MSDPKDPLHPEWNTDDIRQGELFKADGMQRAEMHGPPSWRGQAELALRYVAERRERFTTDPVWTVLDSWGVPKPHEPKVIGPLMKAACGWHWCEPTGEYVPSVLPQNHRRPVLVYQSWLCEKRRSA